MNREYIEYENGRDYSGHEDDYGVYYEEPYDEQGYYYGARESISSTGSPDMQNPYQIGIDTSGLAGSMGSLGLNRGGMQYGSMSGRLATMGRQQISSQFKVSHPARLELLKLFQCKNAPENHKFYFS